MGLLPPFNKLISRSIFCVWPLMDGCLLFNPIADNGERQCNRSPLPTLCLRNLLRSRR
jgi:hypothetical protein